MGQLAVTTFFVVICGSIQTTLSLDSFRAAVYEHDVLFPTNRTVVTRQEALTDMMKNLKVYANQALKASTQANPFVLSVFMEYKSIL